MRKAAAVILGVGATGLIAFACLLFVFGRGDIARRRVSMEILIAIGITLFAVSAVLWKGADGTQEAGAPGPGERQCGLCGAAAAASGGRWKLLAKPGPADMDVEWGFVCARCLRAGWRNALLFLLLAPAAVALTVWAVIAFHAR